VKTRLVPGRHSCLESSGQSLSLQRSYGRQEYWQLRKAEEVERYRAHITLAGIACIIMREVYATIGESIYPNPSFLSRDFPEASGRLLRNHEEFMFQDIAN